MSSKKNGVSKYFFHLIVLIILAIGITGFIKTYNITSVNDVFLLARDRTVKAKSCGFMEWDCWISGKRGESAGTTLKEPGSTISEDKNNTNNTNSSNSGGREQESSVNGYLDKLNSLQVGVIKPSKEYSRSFYNHWILENGCNTRNRVLARDGKSVEKKDGCKVVKGQWFGVYSGGIIDTPKKIDIDHIIPLKYAHYHGAGSWDGKRREVFANDFDNLISVSAKENRIKGAKGPGEYYPPNRDYSCSYAKKWVDLSIKYSLSVNSEDKSVLGSVLKNCK